MTNITPFTASQYPLASFTLRAGLDEEEARLLSDILVTVDPWRTLNYTTEALARYLLRPDAALHRYAVVVQNKTSGVVCVRYPWLRGAYLELIGLDATARGSGVGSEVLRWLEEQTCLASPNVWIMVSSFNQKARAFYERQGYYAIGIIKDLVEPGYDELLLRKVVR